MPHFEHDMAVNAFSIRTPVAPEEKMLPAVFICKESPTDE
jgi:hypothetical protein